MQRSYRQPAPTRRPAITSAQTTIFESVMMPITGE
jgi:hypothetical protein